MRVEGDQIHVHVAESLPALREALQGGAEMNPWLIGFATVGAMALMTFGVTPRIWQQRIIKFRAFLMLLSEMYQGALDRRSRWSECLEKAKFDC
jgi:hypothetical protein